MMESEERLGGLSFPPQSPPSSSYDDMDMHLYFSTLHNMSDLDYYDYLNGTNNTVVLHAVGGYSTLHIIISSIILTFMMIVVVIGNMLVIIAIATEKSLKNLQNWFIASLAVADFFVGLLIMPFSLANELMGYWIFGSVWCSIHSAMDVLLCTSSIMNICLISLDRYWSITQAVDYLKKRTPARAAVMIGMVWILSALISIPPLLGWRDPEAAKTSPLPQCELSREIGYVLYSALGSFYIPSCIMVFVYIRIYFAARARARRAVRKPPKAKSNLASIEVEDHPPTTPTTTSFSKKPNQMTPSPTPTPTPIPTPIPQANKPPTPPAKIPPTPPTKQVGFQDPLVEPETPRGSCEDPQPEIMVERCSPEADNNNSSKKGTQPPPPPTEAQSTSGEDIIIINETEETEVGGGVTGGEVHPPPEVDVDIVVVNNINKGGQGEEGEVIDSEEEDDQDHPHHPQPSPLVPTIQLKRKSEVEVLTVSELVSEEEVRTSTTTTGSAPPPPLVVNNNELPLPPQSNGARTSSSSQGQGGQRGGTGVRGRLGGGSAPAATTGTAAPRSKRNKLHFLRVEAPIWRTSSSLSLNGDVHILGTLSRSCSRLQLDTDPVSDVDPSSSDSGAVGRCGVVKPLKLRLCQPFFGKSNKSSNKARRDVLDMGKLPSPKQEIRDPEREKRRIARKKEKRATLILGLIMGSFILCWLPFFFLYILEPLCPSCHVAPWGFAIAFWLGYMNSALNPVIYTIFNKDFRRAFRRILFK